MQKRSNAGIESQSLSSAAQSSPGMLLAKARSAPVNTGRTAAIGESLVLTGTLAGQEDVYIDGTVEGTIDLQDGDLIIGPNGNVKADIKARKITVFGRVTGKMYPAERIEILKTASVKGTVRTPRIVVEEGAIFQGKIESFGKEMKFATTGQTKPLIIRQESHS